MSDEQLQIPTPESPPLAPPVQTSTDVDIRGIGKFLVWLVVSLVVVSGLVYGQLLWLRGQIDDRRPAATLRAMERLPPPSPNLQTSPAHDMRRLRAEEDAALQNLQWLDREHTHAQIPIERAMQLLVKNGLPKWPAVVEERKPTRVEP